MPSDCSSAPGPDAGQLQDLRRVDGAAAQHHLAPRLRLRQHAVLAVLDAGGALALAAARGASARGFRRAGSAAPRPASDRPTAAEQRRRPRTVSCSGPTPSCSAPLKSRLQRIAGLLRAGDEGVVQRMIGAQVGHRQRPAAAVKFVGAVFLVLGLAEIRQHVVIRPAGIAQLPPQVEILPLAADVDQPVDRGLSRPAPCRAARRCGGCSCSGTGSVSKYQATLGL